MNNILKINHVSKKFPLFQLEDITFALPEGFIMGMVGPNGAGKTTIIKLILNMLHKDSGEIQVLGFDNVKNGLAIKEQIGVVFDSLYWPGSWSIKLVEKNMKNFYDHWQTDTFHDFLNRFALSPQQKLKTLSKGMQMKLMLACALSHQARLLILDEPTSGLDPLSRDELLEVLREYIEDGTKSVLFSTHITGDLDKSADYITFVNQGQLLFTGEKDSLIDSFRLVKGGSEELTAEMEHHLLGLRKTAFGFEGLADSRQLHLFNTCITEPATLDDIIIYSSKGGSL